jgi:hypothetical protein
MEYKAWIDVKSPRFFIWKAIQYTLLIVSGVKPVIPNKRFIHSPAEKKARTLRSSAGRVRKLDCGS